MAVVGRVIHCIRTHVRAHVRMGHRAQATLTQACDKSKRRKK